MPDDQAVPAPARASLGQLGRLALEARAIDGVAEQGMADMGEMDADLVGSARLQPAGNEAAGPSRSSSRQCVTAWRPRSSATTAIFSRWRGWRPSGASTVPARIGGAPQTSARYSRTSEPVRPWSANSADSP